MHAAPELDLIFGLIALQIGLIDQAQLVTAFRAWTRQKVRPLADLLVARCDLDEANRAAIQALAGRHIKRHAGDAGRNLAPITAARSTSEQLAAIGGPELGARLTRRRFSTCLIHP
jgi:eukaryotic-like serine/threonine-protein kinase